MGVTNIKSFLCGEVMKNMKHLRYNAMICKSRWESVKYFPSSNWSFFSSIELLLSFIIPMIRRDLNKRLYINSNLLLQN